MVVRRAQLGLGQPPAQPAPAASGAGPARQRQALGRGRPSGCARCACAPARRPAPPARATGARRRRPARPCVPRRPPPRRNGLGDQRLGAQAQQFQLCGGDRGAAPAARHRTGRSAAGGGHSEASCSRYSRLAMTRSAWDAPAQSRGAGSGQCSEAPRRRLRAFTQPAAVRRHNRHAGAPPRTGRTHAGQKIQFKRPDGQGVDGYLAEPAQAASAPGIVVIQEWWGLNDQIRRVADMLASRATARWCPTSTAARWRWPPTGTEHLMNDLNFGDAARAGRARRPSTRRPAAPRSASPATVWAALTLLSSVFVPELDAGVAWYGYPRWSTSTPARSIPLMGHWATRMCPSRSRGGRSRRDQARCRRRALRVPPLPGQARVLERRPIQGPAVPGEVRRRAGCTSLGSHAGILRSPPALRGAVSGRRSAPSTAVPGRPCAGCPSRRAQAGAAPVVAAEQAGDEVRRHGLQPREVLAQQRAIADLASEAIISTRHIGWVACAWMARSAQSCRACQSRSMKATRRAPCRRCPASGRRAHRRAWSASSRARSTLPSAASHVAQVERTVASFGLSCSAWRRSAAPAAESPTAPAPRRAGSTSGCRAAPPPSACRRHGAPRPALAPVLRPGHEHPPAVHVGQHVPGQRAARSPRWPARQLDRVSERRACRRTSNRSSPWRRARPGRPFAIAALADSEMRISSASISGTRVLTTWRVMRSARTRRSARRRSARPRPGGRTARRPAGPRCAPVAGAPHAAR